VTMSAAVCPAAGVAGSSRTVTGAGPSTIRVV